MIKFHTVSQSFSDDEILYRADNGDLYLKQGVKRKYYPDETEDTASLLNQDLALMGKLSKEDESFD